MTRDQHSRPGGLPVLDDETWETPARLSAREGRAAAGEDRRWRRAEADDETGEDE